MGMRPGDYYLQPLFTFREGLNSNRYRGIDFRTIAVQHAMDQAWRIIETSLQFRPKVMNPVSTPLLMAIEEECQQRNIDIKDVFASYNAVVFGGEPPSPRIQKLLQSWGVDMYQLTSLGDVSSATDCSAHAGFHAWEDLAFIECLEPGTNKPVADGERGELVVTALQDQVAPLVRYRTDDLITFTRQPCTCGRTHGRFEVLGRLGDQLLIQGKSILPRDVMPLVEAIPETIKTLFQIIAKAKTMDTLMLRVGYEPALLSTSTDDLRARLTQLLSAELQVPVEIELVVNAELLKLGPPHKIPRVSKH
jgi:phenylacetate-CoA ligase